MENNKEEILQKNLMRQRKNGWSDINDDEREAIFQFADGYIDFLNQGKTEREIVQFTKQLLEKHGFADVEIVPKLKPGDRVYSVNKEKGMFIAVIGEDALTEGTHIIGSHIDSPRLDLKQNPLFEDSDLAFFKTHYYGGIKKYQWTTIPLSLHGVIVKSNGETIQINIGEDDKDPIFTITDLLPHLSAKQDKATLREGILAENLNIIVGSMPLSDVDTDRIKTNILNLLNKKYGITEMDFNSAEIEAVPAFKAKSSGLDESLVAAYGHDDRVCAYPSLMAMLNLTVPKTTAICIFADKEEVGSQGNTGMSSNNFELFLMNLMEKTGIENPYALQRLLSNSKCLSADVTAGFDPTYPAVMEKNNAAFLNGGVCIKKYTGARGKSGASDANAEFVAYIRGIFEKNNVVYQSAQLGKVDEGGGGTIAYILANKGMDVLDCGVPILSMHSPYEIASKFDIYMAYRAYLAFWN